MTAIFHWFGTCAVDSECGWMQLLVQEFEETRQGGHQNPQQWHEVGPEDRRHSFRREENIQAQQSVEEEY